MPQTSVARRPMWSAVQPPTSWDSVRAGPVRDQREADLARGEPALRREVEDGERLDERAGPVDQRAGPQHPVRRGSGGRADGERGTRPAKHRVRPDREPYGRADRSVLGGSGHGRGHDRTGVRPLRRGRGGRRLPRAGPDEGWSADMVVAHVTLNNDHWTRAAREVVAGGGRRTTTRRSSTRTPCSRHLDGLGDQAARGRGPERSIREVAAAYDALGDLGTRIPVRIVSGGELVADGRCRRRHDRGQRDVPPADAPRAAARAATGGLIGPQPGQRTASYLT